MFTGERKMYHKCSVKGCERQVASHGMCSLHWRRYQKGKRGAELEKPVQYHDRSEPGPCSVEGCNRTAKSRGMCHPHYKRWLRGTLHETLEKPIRGDNPNPKCSVEGCVRTPLAGGLCNAHYIRAKKGQDLSIPIRLRGFKDKKCKVEGCENTVGERGAFGLCSKHYKRLGRIRLWEKIIEQKGGKCQRCGGVFPSAVYDLHHRDPKEKEFSIGAVILAKSEQAILKEAEKCDLLCANCHRLEHFGDDSDLHLLQRGWEGIPPWQ